MDFTQWAKDNRLNDATMQLLNKEEMDSLDTLKECSEDDINSLSISKGQKIILRKAVAELNKKKTSTKGKDSPLSDWLKAKQIKQTTIDKLHEMDFDSEDALLSISDDDMAKLDITGGQRSMLRNVIKERRSELGGYGTTMSANTQQHLPSVCEDSSTLPPKPDFSSPPPPYERVNSAMSQPTRTTAVSRAKPKTQNPTTVSNPKRTSSTKAPSVKHVGQKQTEKSKVTTSSKKSSDKGVWESIKEATGWEQFKSFLGSLGESSSSCSHEMVNGMKVVHIPVKRGFENATSKVRICTIGDVPVGRDEKTIMMVGATGTGKSTLIDGFCNHLFGVKWEESTRFRLINEHSDEKKNKAKGQSQSQTEWITVYRIGNRKNQKFPFTLNLIDTPGFGDTRGIKRDRELVEQIRALFGNPKQYQIDSIDAVCFLAKAPDARLTPTQSYIFQAILSIFGKNIADNIVVMITFADGAKPPVLEAIKAAKMPYHKVFKFNNSALFANNGASQGASGGDDDDDGSTFSEMFWKMGNLSFDNFFTCLSKMDPKSLDLTAEVLEKRKNLQDTLNYLEEKMREGLAKMSQLKEETRIFQENEAEIKRNSNFKYKVTEARAREIPCENNRHVTHCMNCHNTCHDDCAYKDDADKASCIAMDANGFCTRCDQHCVWSDHKNSGFRLVMEYEEVEKTYEDKLRKYQEATGERFNQMSVLDLMQGEYAEIQCEVEQQVKKCRSILERLRKIALKPDPLSEVDYIEILIDAEMQERKPGHRERIRELNDIKAKAERLRQVKNKEKLMPRPQSAAQHA